VLISYDNTIYKVRYTNIFQKMSSNNKNDSSQKFLEFGIITNYIQMILRKH